MGCLRRESWISFSDNYRHIHNGMYHFLRTSVRRTRERVASFRDDAALRRNKELFLLYERFAAARENGRII